MWSWFPGEVDSPSSVEASFRRDASPAAHVVRDTIAKEKGRPVSPMKEVAWTALGIVLFLAVVDYFLDYFQIGTWLSSRSDALWWNVLPWILIGLIWFFMIRMFRNRRGGPAEAD